tara:strand:+ start:886 stop:1005 length:120 start_codon:yes stop_codon:yes gene_type:complete
MRKTTVAAAISITAPTTAARRGVVVLVNVGDGLLSKLVS